MQTQENRLNANEQNEIAGLDFTPIDVPSEERLELENDVPSKATTEEKALPRTLFVTGAVGAFVLVGMGFWQFVQPKNTQITRTSTETVEEEKPQQVEPDYRGRLALRDQQNEFNDRVVSVEPSTKTTVAPRRTYPSQPRVVTRTITKTVNSPAAPRYQPQPRQQIASLPKEQVNPFERWNQLSGVGQIGLSKLPDLPKPKSSDSKQERKSRTKETTTPRGLEATTVSFNPRSTNDEELGLSPGETGILNRTEQNTESYDSGVYEIAFGTSVPGTVSTPLLWDESASSENQSFKRFTVTLTQDLTDTEGKVALPSGTVVVAEASKVNSKNRLVQASAIAIVYKDERGKIKQQPIPSDTIMIGGGKDQPLIAKGYFDYGSTIAKSDLLVSSLSGVGKIGKVLTQPRRTSTFSGGLFGEYSSTFTENRDPKIWAAAMDGFFSPLAERISDRSEREIEELAQRPNVSIIAPNTQVSLVVNNFLTIER
jgi:hypothetical protein